MSGCVTQPADLPTPPNTEITTSKAFSIHGGLQGPQQEGGCSATSHVHSPSPSKTPPACSSSQRQSEGVLCSALIDGLGQSTDKSTPVLAHAITPEQGQEESKSKGQCLFLQQGRDLKHQYQVSIHMMVSSSRMMTGRGNPDVAPGWC